MVNNGVRFWIVFLYLNSGKINSICLEEENHHPCSIDGTANMAAPIVVIWIILVNLTSVLGILF